MSTGSAKDANYYAEAWKFACIFLDLLHYQALMSHIAGANNCAANHFISLYPRYTQGLPPPPLQRMASPDSDWSPCTSMYGVQALLVETGHAQHERHTIQEFLTTCPSTIKPVELQCQPQNPHLYFLLSFITQHSICHNQSILMLAVTHHFLTKCLSCLHQVLKSICKGRDTILHHQVCHPITIDVMKGIKKALSEQLYSLVSIFVCSSDFTNPINNWLHP